ncbi:Lipid-A-disaccharide synthase [Minicystis rosea]|nr:Lipid-A-disaccharide synthase [Minicystis rosea]
MTDVLVVAGEPSGDRIAALAARALVADGFHCAGIAGPAARAAGVEILADGGRLGAMGFADVARRLPDLAASLAQLFARVRRTPPRAALLVNFTELNQRLGRLLRARGTRVLWCVAPQVWAWRPRRIAALHDSVDRLAVILPFEETLWRRAGYDASYVGHPSLDVPRRDRHTLRNELGIAADARAVAVLPGSRAGEVRRLAQPLAEAAARLASSGAIARMILAPGLDPRARDLASAAADATGIAVVEGDADHGAAPLLPAFDAALCASGTASLEAALSGAAPVVTYRLDPIAHAIAKRLVRTPHIALPNVLLGRRAFPELVQGDVTAARIAAAAQALLADPEATARDTRELGAVLAAPSSSSFGERVASLLLPWLR